MFDPAVAVNSADGPLHDQKPVSSATREDDSDGEHLPEFLHTEDTACLPSRGSHPPLTRSRSLAYWGRLSIQSDVIGYPDLIGARW